MNVFAKLPGGKSVPHGRVVGTVYVRSIDKKTIRWSDKTIPLNSTAIPKLTAVGCQFLTYIYMGTHAKIVYEIPFQRALNVGELVTNEYGEENLRIPISECKIKERIPYQAREEEKKTIQSKLF